ncbi:MobF family relaxase [Cryobacterium zhongshanensis]|uniref:Relaxase domain-containing protein n=1 Tax=Cryobacterium zhongshanensis TaxID=2928153 RepID=A0AA41QXU3_9MICO|nr:MobF family relaxase [Cryobacterium zhongshanensis]MCI4660175.1 relaxase domain-containing protein [Cryobacterium zhongshanensis]
MAEVGAVTVSMRVMSAGDGYKYLLRTVAAGDGKRSLSTPLTRYYTAEGTPPGRWMGGGLRSLGGGLIVEGGVVKETQLQLLIGLGRDPVTGEALGRAYPVYGTAADGPSAARGESGREAGPTGRASVAAASAGDQSGAGQRRAVAGYDFTFSIPKSASILWGIADAPTQALIAEAHHAAVAEVLAYMEREVAATRTGSTAQGGAVAQVDVTGLIATAFDHFDSRAGDPHLHTHVVISNKVLTVLDGKWRSLDGRPMHEAVVALSELHETLFADALTRSLGVQWEMRERGRDRHLAWAISTVPEALVAEFSMRSRHIDVETDRLIEAYVSRHGRRPNPVMIVKLRAQATLSTRPVKQVHSLAELTAAWRERAARVLGGDITTVVSAASANRSVLVLRAEDVPLEAIDALGLSVMRTVSEKRATWRHWNLTAEAARQTMPHRFASASDREAVIGRVVDVAERASLRITPSELASSPAAFQRDDGTSVFRPKHSMVFTSTELLDAESRLLERAGDLTGPRVAAATLRSAARTRLPGGGVLAEDQFAALATITGSGRVLDVLVGPAGAGKTTAMNALRRAWETAQGSGSVVGLAPSAAAAQVLSEDLGITTENLAKWWHNHLVNGATFSAGQLVIIDEASLAGTLSLDRISALAADAGAKVLLVGDYAQLQSVDAGGALSLLVHDRADAPELVDVHRFVNDWEKTASLGLRQGNPESIDLYLAHDRVREGDTEAMAEAAYEAWRVDARAGRVTVLISDSTEAVMALNVRARTELILEGRVDALREVALHDGTCAAVGDTVITRRNDRGLRAGRTWVRNGDRWAVIGVDRNGSVEVRRHGRRWGSTVRLPAEYVTRHVELGYAITSHRAQGITTDTAHVVVAPGMTRENLYVAMTRGREANSAYVAVDRPDVAHVGPRPGDNDDASARSILYGVLQHVGAELSAHETITAEQNAWGSIAQLAAEYETLAAAAQHDRWVSLVRASGLSPGHVDEVIESDAFGPLTAELRRAEAHHFDIANLLARVVAARGFEDAQDVAAILRTRVASATARDSGAGRSRRIPRLVAGLIPKAIGPMDAASRRALDERSDLIEARASAALDEALLTGDTWTRALGVAPRGSVAAAWRLHGCTVAAYRDRYGIVGGRPLGLAPEATAQRLDFAHARAALDAAPHLAEERHAYDGPRPTVAAGLPPASIRF